MINYERIPRPPPGPPGRTMKECFGLLIETKESKGRKKRYKLKMKLWSLINEIRIS